MDFVTHFSLSMGGHDAMWVMIDRLTKNAHFFAMNLRMFMAKLT